MNYDYTNNFNGMVDDLIDGFQDGRFNPQDPDAPSLTDQDFNSALLEGLEDQRADFWKLLLQFMYNEMSNINDNVIKQTYFPNDFQSFVELLNDRIDIDNPDNENRWNEIWNHFKNIAKQQGSIPIWNESVARALEQFFNTFGEDGKIYLRKPSNEYPEGVYIYIKDIMRANAGRSFSGTPWVSPNINSDNKTYDETRGNDKILSVLNNNSNLQFTREALDGEYDDSFESSMARWTRLIMPEYLRSVEIEDLNRNFWVIGQTLSALCAFLFGPDAPFSGLYEKIFNELVQLWENVMYLWLYAAISSQPKEITDCHIEVIPIANDELQSYVKFDNFDRDTDKDYAINNFINQVYEASIAKSKYIINQYNNSNIIIFPKFRYDNYKHNYYSEEIWPCVIFYNRNTAKMTCRPIYIQNMNTQLNESPWIEQFLIDIKVKELRDKLWSVKENEINWQFITAEDADTDEIYEADPYYSLVRTVPHISGYYKNGHLYVNEFELKCYDVAAFLKKKAEDGSANMEDYLIMSYSPSSSYQPEALITGMNDTSANNYPFYLLEKIDNDLETPISSQPELLTICQGYYQGEFPSWLWALKDSEEEVYCYEVIIDEVPLIPYSYRLEDIVNLYRVPNRSNMNTAFNNYNVHDSFISDKNDFVKKSNGTNPYEIPTLDGGRIIWDTFESQKNYLTICTDWNFYEYGVDPSHQDPNGQLTYISQNSEYNDYAASHYNWNCNAINESLSIVSSPIYGDIIKDQQILLSSCLNPQWERLIKTGITQLVLITGYHPCEFSRTDGVDFGNEQSSYSYKTIDGNNDIIDIHWEVEDSENKPILQYYPIAKQEFVSSGAVIFDIYKQEQQLSQLYTILYKEYHEVNYVPYALLNQNLNSSQLEGQKKVKRFQYLLLPKNVSDSDKGKFLDDWVLIVQDVCLGVGVKDQYKNYRCHLEGEDDSIVTSINIHVFTSNGDYVRKTIDRYKDKNYSDIETNIDCSVWKVKYSGDRPTTAENKEYFDYIYCGSLETDSETHVPKYSFFDLNNERHYNYFTTAPTQYKLYYNLYGGNNYDFNKYPNTGLATKEKVSVEYEVI